MGGGKLGEDGSLGLLERKRLSSGFIGLIEADFCSVGIAGASDVDGKIRLFGGFCGRDSGIGPAQRAKTTIWN